MRNALAYIVEHSTMFDFKPSVRGAEVAMVHFDLPKRAIAPC